MTQDAFPRSAILAAWARSWRAGHVSYDEVVDEVRGRDAEHLVDGVPATLTAVDLSEGLRAFSALRPDEIRLVLPAPGDPRGLPGRGPFTDAALGAGEGVVCGDAGVVPAVDARFSGSGDVWHVITWRLLPLAPELPDVLADRPAPDPLTVAEAEHDLVVALREATDALRRLDVARWRPELGAALTDLRRGTAPTDLPPGYDPRCERLLARAGTVAGILTLAASDAPGASITAFEAGERDIALRPLATAARRAQLAAINAPLR